MLNTFLVDKNHRHGTSSKRVSKTVEFIDRVDANENKYNVPETKRSFAFKTECHIVLVSSYFSFKDISQYIFIYIGTHFEGSLRLIS